MTVFTRVKKKSTGSFTSNLRHEMNNAHMIFEKLLTHNCTLIPLKRKRENSYKGLRLTLP